MKLITLLIILACFKVSASVYAQTITLKEKNAPLTKVFKQIEQQSGYSFFYKNEMLKQMQKVSITVQNASLTDVLEKCFSNQTLTYEVIDNTIIVKTKEKPVVQKVKILFTSPILIKGRVTDTAGRALPGALIKVKGTDKAVTANDDGEFEITGVDEKAILVITYVGYITTEVPVNENTALAIMLQPDIALLNVVKIVSTGYQSIPKERATGSFAQPTKQIYDVRVAPDVISKLSGITSGLVFNANTTNTLSGKTDINIRGQSTIFANSQPLIVVDNFAYSGDISSINPNDVEDVTILKDAAAASIWGVRAGNGVIVIRTKRGSRNKAPQISFNANITVAQKPDLKYDPNYIASTDFIEVEKFLFTKGKYDGFLNNPYTAVSPVVELLAAKRAGQIGQNEADLQIGALANNDVRDDISKYFYKKAVNQQYALAISGGSDKSSYYFSTGYDKSLQNLKNNSSDRLTINSRNTFYMLKGLELTADINYIKSSRRQDNIVTQLITGGNYSAIYPYAKFADTQGNPLSIVKQYKKSFVDAAPASGYLDWSFYPLKELGLQDNTVQYSDIRLSPSLKYNIIKGLNAEVKYQYENYSTDTRNLQGQETFYTRNLINQYAEFTDNRVTGYNIPLGGILFQGNTRMASYNIRGQVNYSASWAKHELSILAGYEQSQAVTSGSSSILYGYNDDTGSFTNVNFATNYPQNPLGNYGPVSNSAGTSRITDRVRSKFANAAYTYNRRYTISASGRIDGSNYFGVDANLKSVPLWSVGAKWNIAEEGFYHLAWLPTLQLRTSYGYNGNLNRSIAGVTTFRSASNSSWTNFPYATVSNFGNPDLTWEKSAITNIGVDFGTKAGRLSGSLEYFSRKGTNLIGDKSMAPSSGLTVFRGNYADMVAKGFDIQLTSKNLDGPVKWSTTLLGSHAVERVSRYDAPILAALAVNANGTGNSISPFQGYPVYSIWSYKWAGLDPANGDPQGYDANGNISKDYAILTSPDSLKRLVYSGSARPTYFGGISNTFSYRNFTLSVNVSYKFGYYFRRGSISYTTLFNNWTGQNKEIAQRWQSPGDEKITNVPSMVYPGDYNRDAFYNFSKVTVEKADHIRLQDISLSYELSKQKIHKLPFEHISIYGYANNLAILWRANKLGLDPDYPTGYPTPKTFALGIKGSF
ncbi:SusC/RagA family TonB-linked outer membrane protein [Mucilaginibacter polytrichastri]|nr:SusC/RagA family TonB-linked outer membrane protein [Mucilaginibacter polytrichastri]